MRILWVKAGGLVPPDTGGKIRSYHILEELARRHEVTLFTFYPAHFGDVHHELERIFSRVVCCPLQIPATKSLADYANYVRHLFSPYPHAMVKYYRPGVSPALRKLLGTETFDAIVCDFVHPAGVIPWDHPSPKILFTHNVEAVIWQRHCQLATNLLWKAVCWREYRAMERMERFYLKRADHVLTVSENDRDLFARFVEPSKISVIPTGVDVNYFRPGNGDEKSNTLVFTGSMDWLPNEDGVIYFIEQILPLIRQQIPETALWVVGRCPSQRLSSLGAKDKGVRVTDQVEDIRPYVYDAAAYVVPLRIGGGTRLKIFEAMAMGKAVVSTSIGAEGLPVEHGKDIILADEPQDFARQVVNLLEHRAARSALGAAARQLVEQRHSWASVAARFEEVLDEVAHTKSFAGVGKVQPEVHTRAGAENPFEVS